MRYLSWTDIVMTWICTALVQDDTVLFILGQIDPFSFYNLAQLFALRTETINHQPEVMQEITQLILFTFIKW